MFFKIYKYFFENKTIGKTATAKSMVPSKTKGGNVSHLQRLRHNGAGIFRRTDPEESENTMKSTGASLLFHHPHRIQGPWAQTSTMTTENGFFMYVLHKRTCLLFFLFL
jgi:hypothetical protein